MKLAIGRSTFTIVAHGFADGPAQALRDYLVQQHAKEVVTVLHPLNEPGPHRISIQSGGRVQHRELSLPFRAPLTYPLDLLVPLKLPLSDVWFGFDNLSCFRGLVRRSRGRTGKVVYWAVDFVPNRFGPTLKTRIYEGLDRFVVARVDARIELSSTALAKRDERVGSATKKARSFVVEMGAWLDRMPKTDPQKRAERQVVYVGHLVQRQGVDVLLGAIQLLNRRGFEVSAQIVGEGPESGTLRQLARDLDIANHVVFHGFIESLPEIERILSVSSLAVAPYRRESTSFTQYADPGKLKLYMGAGLPIVMTDVPPNARELEVAGAAKIATDDPGPFAEAIQQVLSTKSLWESMHQAALRTAQDYDWNRLLSRAMARLGFSS